ncbi:MAG: SGNH/GDSL hydrolase family protein [Acidiferrobacterales bacterium]
MNIICFGDSITEAATCPPELGWPTLLQMLLDKAATRKFVVHNRGVGGDTTACGFDRLETDVLPLLPGLVIVQFGFNDANVRDWAAVPRVGLREFEKNLCEFHRITKARTSRCVFIVNHTLGPVVGTQGNGKSYQENFEPYNLLIRDTAHRLDAPIVDLPALMARRDVNPTTIVADDGLHLNVSGNRAYADMVFERLQQILGGSG